MKEAFWEHVCGMVWLTRELAVINVILLLLLVFSFLYIRPGSPSFNAALMSLFLLLPLFLLVTVLRVKCRKY